MSLFSNVTTAVQKDEQWLITEIQKGWTALQTAEKTVETDVLGIFNWIATHQQQIQQTLTGVLTGLQTASVLVPQLAPAVATATVAINASTAAINVLAQGIQQGSTPLSTLVTAYHTVKDAQTAVNGVLKTAATKPSVVPSAPVAATAS